MGSLLTVEEQLSAAGAAPGLGEVRSWGGAGTERLVFEQAGGRVNPVGYNWEAQAFCALD